MAYYKRNSYKDSLEFKYPRNQYIRVPEVRVITEEGESLGILKTHDALNMAQEQELDLVLISPVANPPVAKIISWSKFKYEQSKKSKTVSKKSSQNKEMWFKPQTGEGDLEHKVKKIKEFLSEKSKVKITIKPGRNRRLEKSVYFDQINKVLVMLKENCEVETPPKVEGRNVYAIIKPK